VNTNDFLSKIVASTKQRVALAKQRTPLEDVVAAVGNRPPAQGNASFAAALAKPSLSFICEVKQASPSKGQIAGEHESGAAFPYLEIAQSYAAAGADAISVLTEPEFFKGSARYLQEIAREVRVPTLRKDFVLDEYQVYEAALLGASAVLLIAAILNDEELERLRTLTEQLGMSALVEAHDLAEVKRALAAGAQIVGVNNRNLVTFEVDLRTSLKLREAVPAGVLYVAESGIRTPEDVSALAQAGVDAALIGETLMRAGDKAECLAALREAANV
jgi:indole-3-glycerol phosphate synthase